MENYEMNISWNEDFEEDFVSSLFAHAVQFFQALRCMAGFSEPTYSRPARFQRCKRNLGSEGLCPIYNNKISSRDVCLGDFLAFETFEPSK